MIHGSTLRKAGIIARAAGQLVTRSRTGPAILRGLHATALSFGKVLHQLWLEVTGFTFLVMAGIGGLAGIREYAKYQAGRSLGPGRLIVAICFTVSFAWFGVSSFSRVKKKKG